MNRLLGVSVRPVRSDRLVLPYDGCETDHCGLATRPGCDPADLVSVGSHGEVDHLDGVESKRRP